MMASAGLGAGIPYAVEVHDASRIAVVVGAALVHLPAIWVLSGTAAALYGWFPRALPAAWIVLSGCFVNGFLGRILHTPSWISALSPFQHTPQLPAAAFTPVPLVILAALAVALILMGVGAFRRRDLG